MGDGQGGERNSSAGVDAQSWTTVKTSDEIKDLHNRNTPFKWGGKAHPEMEKEDRLKSRQEKKPSRHRLMKVELYCTKFTTENH